MMLEAPGDFEQIDYSGLQCQLTAFSIGKKVQEQELRLAEIMSHEVHTEEQSWASLNVRFVFFNDSSQWSMEKPEHIANEFHLWSLCEKALISMLTSR